MLEVSPSTVSTNLTVKTLLFLKNFKSHSYQPDNLHHQSSLLNSNSFVAKLSSRFPLLHSSIKTQNHIQIQNTTKLKMANEIWIVPFIGQGHLFPLMELCKQLASRNFKAVFVISSNLSSSVPSSLRQFPLVQIAEIPDEIPPPLSSGSSPLPQPNSGPPRPHHDRHNQMGVGLEKLLSTRYDNPDSATPVCAVLDIMTGWTAEVFKKFGIPTVAFFTSGACSAAMEYAMWKAQPLDIKSGKTRLLPGLPEEMALTLSDLKQQSRGPPLPIHGGGPPPGAGAGFPPPGPPPSGHSDGPPLSLGGDFPPPGLPPPLGPGVDFPPHGLPPPFEGPGQQRMGPPKPGGRPPWLDEADRSIALMINTCDDLERPFIEYLAKQIGKPVWGVGPLLPEQYWKSDGSILRDGKLRTSNRRSNVSEDEVIEWLDSKSNGSVLYVSFGSEVGPTVEEFSILAEALEASNRPFIWAVQSGSGRPPGPPSKGEEGYFPHGLDGRVGKRGLIIHGWAPQLLILSHPSTGGFLSHCGWNSTVEAIGRGVPFLAWPIRGDQYHDAKLVVSFLKVGYLISDDISEKINKEDIVKGIEKLMGDEDMKQRAVTLSAKFEHGFPTSSAAALDAFRDFVAQKAA